MTSSGVFNHEFIVFGGELFIETKRQYCEVKIVMRPSNARLMRRGWGGMNTNGSGLVREVNDFRF